MSFFGGVDLSLLGDKDNGKSLLDYGCGKGDFSIFFLKQGFKVTAVDINESMEKFIRNKLTSDENERFDFYCLDAEKDFFPDCYLNFDYILCRETLEHIRNYEKVIRELSFLLKNDGLFLLSIPTSFTEKYFSFWDFGWLKKCGHVNIFSKKDIISLAKKYDLNIAKIGKYSFRRTIFWSIVTPFKINHDMGDILNHKKLARTASFLSDCICYFNFVEKLGDSLLPKSYIFYFKKNRDEF